MSNTQPAVSIEAYSIDDMAERYRISAQQVRNEITAGRLSAKRTGRRLLIEPTEARRWFKDLPSERV